ncbi:OLC1v1001561C1 [Oldenlandia corymbosa var. corymbosa]|uniref:OLC1v1001561C1 n=1 Tax=Oldenlandia corymbosa var. corymbosa TaxID=529605 RepID=A0AAV1D5J4_OLDCO|nr:OLC1v1001561C1 [Oldenlandia corymbosa var. corymbosa]
MEGTDGTGDDRTFRVNFSSEGVLKLRENVKEKLKEYMGDYTDDTLVEYVIVLLKNGRRKDEARNELNVFLDDDSDSFVAWLWDHLGSNINLYVQPKQQSHPDGVLKKNPVAREHTGRGSQPVESESTKLKQDKSQKSQPSNELKGLQVDKGKRPSLHSIVADTVNSNRDSHRVSRQKQSISPEPVRRKRNRPEERQQVKREGVSHAIIAAPRRLLQFAVRDAVGTSKPSNLTSEPSLKRLRSVVSTSAEDVNLKEHPHRNRPLARVPNGVSAAMRAVAEAAEDVQRTKSSTNVFNRLGHRREYSENMNQLVEHGNDAGEDGEFKTYKTNEEQEGLDYDQRHNYNDRYVSDRSALQRETRLYNEPSLVDNDLEVNARNRGVMSVDRAGTSGGGRVESLPLVQHGMPSNAKKIKTQDLRKELRVALDVDNQKLKPTNEVFPRQSGMLLMKENSNPVPVANSNEISEDLKQVSQKNQFHTPGLDPTGEQTEDEDSRTLFVNNVHFAATKDSLSRHFNKSGGVLKVVILTDTATGQPKGSAYVEFTSKEVAENALSLDGTSFMSRILRVVRKSAAQVEATSLSPWPRVVRASPYSVSRYVRPPFPRGATGVYRSRFPVKPGARSFQWKRETQPSTSETSITSPSNTGSSIPRSLTYVRPEAKANGS